MTVKKATAKKSVSPAGIQDVPANPIADKMVTGQVHGITDVPAETGTPQDNPEAIQPAIAGEHNESVVNPVAPVPEPANVPEATERKVATPDAQDEPTFHTGEDFNRLKSVFLKALERGNFDIDHARELKREAGVL